MQKVEINSISMITRKAYLLSSIILIVNLMGNCQNDDYTSLNLGNIDYGYETVYYIPSDDDDEINTGNAEVDPFEIDSSNFIRIIYKGKPEEIIFEFEENKLKIDTTNFYKETDWSKFNQLPGQSYYCDITKIKRDKNSKKVKLYWTDRKLFADLSIDLKYVKIEIELLDSTGLKQIGKSVTFENKSSNSKGNEESIRVKVKHSY